MTVIEFNLVGDAIFQNVITESPVIEFDLITPIIELITTSGGRGPKGDPGQDGAGATTSPISVVDGTTYIVPATRKVDSISVVPTAGDRVLTVGYSAGTGEVLDAEEVDSLDGASFYIGKYYHTGKTFHFSGFTGQVYIYLLA